MSAAGDADALSRRLRAAEARRADAERAHADALGALRSAPRDDAQRLEQLQSRVRELDKKASLETVRCEELQLELSAAVRSGRSSGGRSRDASSSAGGPPTVTWALPPTSSAASANEIERIMAKIEQDNRILAELEHSRSTTHGVSASDSCHALTDHYSPCPSPVPRVSHHHQHTASNPSNYSMSVTHNPTGYSTSAGSSYGGYSSNPHQVTFSNPVTAPLANNISQISNTLAGIQTNLHGLTGGLSNNLNLTSGLSGTIPSVSTAIASLSLPSTSGLTNLPSTFTGGLSNPLTNLGNALGALSSNLTGTQAYGTQNTYSNPLSNLTSNAMNIKLKPLEEMELGVGRYVRGDARVVTPVTPHQANWALGLESQYGGLDALGSINTGYLHGQQPRSLSRMMPSLPAAGLDLDGRTAQYMNGGGLTEGQVDMLDIPGKGRCCVYIARFNYDPPDIESAEGDLSLTAGDYLLVWGPPDPNASILDAELLDGRRGLVPSHFLQRLVGDDLLEFHQAVVSTLRDSEDGAMGPGMGSSGYGVGSDPGMVSREVARLSDLTDAAEGPDDDDSVPAPRQLTLERQLNKSVLIGWTLPETNFTAAPIESYHVYVDGVLKTTIKAAERTRALVEGVDSNRPHRISVRSVTATRRTSRDAACTMVIGRDTAALGPSCVRASNVTCSQAIISWLPANSNHQHVVCVNNVEVRTVKPGVYRHTITGLAPSTQYRVTVRAKHLRAGPPPGAPIEEAPGAYTDFRTLPKGLPDPPLDIMVEAGPQDGTLLVTWQPISRQPTSGPVTGYSVYADGKKVTDVDSPTGDHALIDIAKLLGLNPKCVTVRTKSRDSQSSDSIPTPIPPAVLRGVAARMSNRSRPTTVRPHHPHHPQQVLEHDENLSDKEIFPNSGMRHDQNQQQQSSGIPAIAITKESSASIDQGSYSEDEMTDSGMRRRHTQQQPTQQQLQQNQQIQQQNQQQQALYHQQHQQTQMQQNQQLQQQGQQAFQNPQQQQYQTNPQQQAYQPHNQQQQYQNQPYQSGAQGQQVYSNASPRNHQERGRPPNPHHQQAANAHLNQPYNPAGTALRGSQPPGPRGAAPQRGQRAQQQAGQQQNKLMRYFVALFDYDPSSMSPNPDACDEELPFSEGDTIKVYGDKDGDGFYWGECRGRRGFVPHNMVIEVSETEATSAPQVQRTTRSDRWVGENYNSAPVKRMVALYDYDPQELSPNVDAEMELSFQTGQLINVYGEMDDDGFYMAEIEGVRGLVPSNFLAEAPASAAGPPNDQYSQQAMQRGISMRGRGQGPGARGPPPPPRDVGPSRGPPHRKADACPPPPPQIDNHTTTSASTQDQLLQGRLRGAAVGQVGPPGVSGPPLALGPQPGTSQAPQLGGQMQNTNVRGRGGSEQSPQQPTATASSFYPSPQSMIAPSSPGLGARRGAPSVVPPTGFQPQPLPSQQPIQQATQQAQPGAPNLMQKFTEITAPGGDILSKGKELIFMKFGLGGK